MRKSTIGVLISLLSIGCGDPSDKGSDDAQESEEAARVGGPYSVEFAVKANPASLGSVSVSIFNAFGETCEGASCQAYPLNQALFQATPASSARFVGWSGCNFVQLGHFAQPSFLENVGVLNETCTANFALDSGSASTPGTVSGYPGQDSDTTEDEEPSTGEKPAAKPATQKPSTGEKPATQKPATQRPASGEKPAAEKPAAEKPAAEEPASGEKPAAEEPASAEKPATSSDTDGVDEDGDVPAFISMGR